MALVHGPDYTFNMTESKPVVLFVDGACLPCTLVNLSGHWPLTVSQFLGDLKNSITPGVVTV